MDIDGVLGPTQRKREEEKNQDTEPQIRVMDKFRDFFNPDFQEVYACPKRSDGQEI